MTAHGHLFGFLLWKTKNKKRNEADVEGEEEEERAVGKISRTAAGSTASLTIVWQEFRFQLCTTLLVSSSPSWPANIFMYSVKSHLFFFKPLFPPLSSHFLPFRLGLPPTYLLFPICQKPQHTLKAGL